MATSFSVMMPDKYVERRALHIEAHLSKAPTADDILKYRAKPPKVCKDCKGTGLAYFPNGNTTPCPGCQGDGLLRESLILRPDDLRDVSKFSINAALVMAQKEYYFNSTLVSYDDGVLRAKESSWKHSERTPSFLDHLDDPYATCSLYPGNGPTETEDRVLGMAIKTLLGARIGVGSKMLRLADLVHEPIPTLFTDKVPCMLYMLPRVTEESVLQLKELLDMEPQEYASGNLPFDERKSDIVPVVFYLPPLPKADSCGLRDLDCEDPIPDSEKSPSWYLEQFGLKTETILDVFLKGAV